MKHAANCQTELHKWGSANSVQFEPTKESFTILSRHSPFGPTFKLLGVDFDPGLSMSDAVLKLHNAGMWRLRSIMKVRRYYDTDEMMCTYKAKILSYLEYRTAAIFHTNSTLLDKIDSIQSKFLREIGITNVDALLEYHLAPLSARRDMGMLGLIHRTVLGFGPAHFVF